MIYIGQYEGKPIYHEEPFVEKTDRKSTKECERRKKNG